MAKIDEAGFTVTTQNDYYAQEVELYLNIDSSWNLDPSTPDGLKIAHDAEVFGNLDEVAKRAYDSKNPRTATGVELDIVSSITGTVRQFGTPSVVDLTFTGSNGASIPLGFLVESVENQEQWRVTGDGTISSGTVTVAAESVNTGAINASVDTLTRIVNPVGGISTVTNSLAATTGLAVQTDSSLRTERSRAVARPGSNQVDNMLGEVLAVENVTDAIILENYTGVVDANGQPAHSIAVIVVGGDDNDIAKSIYVKKNPGVNFWDANNTPIVVNVVSDIHPQNSMDILFSRPTEIPILIDLTIKNDGSVDNAVIEEIKEAIVQYATGQVNFADGFNVSGFSIGEDVAVLRLTTPVNFVLGKYGDSYIETITANSQTVVVAIPFNQTSSFSTGDITVTLT